MAEASRTVLDILLTDVGAQKSQLTDTFTWIDDDKQEANVTVVLCIEALPDRMTSVSFVPPETQP